MFTKYWELQGNQVRIGVDAPKEVAVHREEIYQKVLQERAEAQVSVAGSGS